MDDEKIKVSLILTRETAKFVADAIAYDVSCGTQYGSELCESDLEMQRVQRTLERAAINNKAVL